MKTLSMLIIITVLTLFTVGGGLIGCESPEAPQAQTQSQDQSQDPLSPDSSEMPSEMPSEMTSLEAPPYFDHEQYIKPNTQSYIIRTFRFIKLDEEGKAFGFNLDEKISSEDDEESCGHGDFISPDGEEGVDNQLAELWATIAPLVGEQVHALLQNAINEGRVLVMLEFEGLDDLEDDDDVTLRVFSVTSRPEIGTQGLITPHQSFLFNYENPISVIEGLTVREGRLITAPIDLYIPITILSLDIIAHIELGRISLSLTEESASGFLTGAMNVPVLTEALINTEAESEARLVAPFFERNADMRPVDGVCTYMSMGLMLEAVSAYVIRDEEQE